MEEPKPSQEWDIVKVDQKTNKQHLEIAVVTPNDNINEKKSQKVNS